MALTLSVFALTTSAYFATDSVLVLNPADRVSSAGTLGSVVGEVVDIPSELLSEVSSEDSSSSSLAESSSSSSSSPVSYTHLGTVPPNAGTWQQLGRRRKSTEFYISLIMHRGRFCNHHFEQDGVGLKKQRRGF